MCDLNFIKTEVQFSLFLIKIFQITIQVIIIFIKTNLFFFHFILVAIKKEQYKLYLPTTIGNQCNKGWLWGNNDTARQRLIKQTVISSNQRNNRSVQSQSLCRWLQAEASSIRQLTLPCSLVTLFQPSYFRTLDALFSFRNPITILQ